MPTYFYQQISTFFDTIFNAIFDPKSAIRESAGRSLRAALIVTSQRENSKQSSEPQWYKICYEAANKSFILEQQGASNIQKGMTRDDRIHGGLIILKELFRCSNAKWESRYNSLKQMLPEVHQHSFHESGSSLQSVSNQLTSIVPRLKAPFIEKLGSTQVHMEADQPHGSAIKFASVSLNKY